jgi:hypothetical protein
MDLARLVDAIQRALQRRGVARARDGLTNTEAG